MSDFLSPFFYLQPEDSALKMFVSCENERIIKSLIYYCYNLASLTSRDMKQPQTSINVRMESKVHFKLKKANPHLLFEIELI